MKRLQKRKKKRTNFRMFLLTKGREHDMIEGKNQWMEEIHSESIAYSRFTFGSFV